MKQICLTILILFGITFSLSAETKARDALIDELDKRNADGTHRLSRPQLMQMFWEAQEEDVADRVNALQLLERRQLEEAEVDKTHDLARRWNILRHYLQKAGIGPVTGPKVAFLGFSCNPFEVSGFNPDVLAQLLTRIKAQKPKALFFMGNLIWALRLNEESEEIPNLVELPVVKNDLGNPLFQIAGIYSSKHFQNRLEAFSKFMKQHLGDKIPIYPVIGPYEAVGPDSLEIFRKVFPIPESTVLPTSQLVYTVSVGKGSFAVVSFNAFDKSKDEPLQEIVTEPLLEWVEKTLQSDTFETPFRFAVGCLPAFSPGAAFNNLIGIDRDRSGRTQFWQSLMRNKVVAYFCSNDPIYERNLRFGVWQILSGGAGAWRNLDDEGADTFYNYLLLTIPENPMKHPLLEVYELHGIKRDAVSLTDKPSAIDQFRIISH